MWIQPSDSPAQNLGELTVGEHLKGEFSAITPKKTFDLFVTAEDNPQGTSPTGTQLLKTRVQE